METDFASLERELRGKSSDEDDDQFVDEYADVYEVHDDEDDEDPRT